MPKTPQITTQEKFDKAYETWQIVHTTWDCPEEDASRCAFEAGFNFAVEQSSRAVK